jgi:putative alpha-1,2-mannosidase
MTINLGTGRSLQITATGGGRDKAPYVQSVRVNGQPWNKSWVTWDDIFANGGTLQFVLGPSPADWAIGELPPSPASGG